MLARLLYGGGLALVAAQMFTDGQVRDRGRSGATSGYRASAPHQDSAAMPPRLDSAYDRELPSGQMMVSRGIVRFQER